MCLLVTKTFICPFLEESYESKLLTYCSLRNSIFFLFTKNQFYILAF